MIDFKTPLGQTPRAGGWGLSQVGDCERKLTFVDHPDFAPETFDAKTLRIFAFGHKVEELVAEEIVARGHKLTDQQGVIKWCDRVGHIDGVIDELTLWECKSLNSFAFNGSKNIPGLIKVGVKEKYPQYYDQIQAYLNGKKLTQSLFTGLNKDNSIIYQEVIPYCEKESMRLWNKIHLLNGYRDRGELHPIPDWVTWHCKYCNYAKPCKELA